MKTNPYPISPKVAGLCTTLLCSSLILGGCAKAKIAGPRTQNPDRIVIDDFIDAKVENTAQEQTPSDLANNESNSSHTREVTPSPSESLDGLTLTAEPEASSPIAVTPQTSTTTQLTYDGSLSLLDAKVGDVNGKPIFTNSFFDPIEDRLIAESARLTPTQWYRSAGQTIANRLDGIIADELLRAEALASLTPTQRVGLQAFLSNFRNNLLSQNLGSAQLASRRIQQDEGVTLDEALRQKEVDTLVQLTLITEINRRVNVSWRDIKQRYERDIDLFSPPPTANFRVIRAFSSDTDTVVQITTQLNDGVAFLKIAASPLNNFNTDSDGYHTVLIEDSFENTKFFGADILNEKTQQLSIGESVGPIELGSTLYWIRLMDIEQESISLYDAQLQIQRDLNIERRREAQVEYFDRLRSRAKISSRDEVLLRLLEIAEDRYGPQG